MTRWDEIKSDVILCAFFSVSVYAGFLTGWVFRELPPRPIIIASAAPVADSMFFNSPKGIDK